MNTDLSTEPTVQVAEKIERVKRLRDFARFTSEIAQLPADDLAELRPALSAIHFDMSVALQESEAGR
jgi:hypothetical protein